VALQPQALQFDIERSRANLLQLRLALRGIPNAEERDSAQKAIEDLAATLEGFGAAEEQMRKQNGQMGASLAMTDTERSHYLEFFKHAPIGYIVTDTAGLIRTANGTAGAILGDDTDRLTGKPLALFFHEREARNLAHQMAVAASEKESRTWESRVHARENTPPAAVSVTLVPIADCQASTVNGFRLIMQDLTELIKSKNRIRDLEDGLWRRVAERTARLADDNERLKLVVAKYVHRYGALPADEPPPSKM
jgi:PAS domain S-box-containing protein